MPVARLRLLGGVDLKDATGKEIRSVLAQPKRLALLAYLALAGSGRYLRRDTLLALFWPEADQSAARHALRTSLHFLRQALGEGVVSGRGQEELGFGAGGLWCDALEFERALSEGRAAEALALYRGELLEGLFVPEASPEFEVWLDAERQRLRSRAGEAAITLVEEAERQGNTALGHHWALRCLELAPHDEAMLRRLLESLLRQGNRAGALDLYERFASRLVKELELEPSSETRGLVERIRRPEPARPLPSTAPQAAMRAAAAPAVTPRRIGSLVAVLGVATLAVVATLWVLQQRKPANPPILAVGTIESRLAAPDSSDPAAALRDLLATDLARVTGLQVVSEARLIELLGQLGVRAETPAARTDAARRAGAQDLIEGVLYRRAPALLRLDLRRVDLKSGVLRGAMTAEAADIFALADSATARLGRAFGLAVPIDPLARVTTTSLAARRLYEDGLREYYQADGALALRFFRAALTEDSSFAMAAYYAALSAEWAEPDAATGLIMQARRDAASLPERERLIIEAGWARLANDPSTVAVAESLATRFPPSPDGEYAWGFALLWSGEPRAGVIHLTRAVAMDSLGLAGRTPRCRACEALVATVAALNSLGERFAAESTARAWVARQPESGTAWKVLADYLERAGRGPEALGTARHLGQLVPATAAGYLWMRARLGVRAGDFADADRFFASELAVPRMEDEAQWWLVISLRNQGRLSEAFEQARRFRLRGGQGGALAEAQVLYEMGRFREAATRFESMATAALRLSPTDSALGSLGNLARRGTWSLTHLAATRAAAGDTAGLTVLADSMERLGSRSGFGRDRKLHFFVRGLLARARHRPEEAVTLFRQAQTTWIGGYSRINLELGRVLLELNRPLEAVPVLRAGLQWDLEANNFYASHRELHRELARAFRAAGLKDSAVVHERWGT